MIDLNLNLPRPELTNYLKQYIPFYATNIEGTMLVKDISSQYFRDYYKTFIFNNSNEYFLGWPDGTKKMKIKNGIILTKTIEEAQDHYKKKKAKQIQSDFFEVEQKYKEYRMFMEENPEYFI